MKKLLTILALLTITSAGLAQGESTLYRTIKENYETKADSMTRAFIESFMIKEKGVTEPCMLNNAHKEGNGDETNLRSIG